MMRLILFNSLDFIIINEQLKLNYIGMVYKNKYVYILYIQLLTLYSYRKNKKKTGELFKNNS